MNKGYLIFANLDVNDGYHLQINLSSFMKNAGRIQMEDIISGDRHESQVSDIEIDIEPCGIRIYRIDN
jgi:hypothetical protein